MTCRLFVPGRIEVLGKHTDYAGGRSLLAAVDRGFTALVEPTGGDRISIRDTGRGETVSLPVPQDGTPVEVRPSRGASSRTSGRTRSGIQPEPGWAVYPRTVIRRVARDFPGTLRGCRIEIEGTLPSAAGLSTSSALVTALFLALDAACEFSATEAYRASIGDPIVDPGGGDAVDDGDTADALDSGGAGHRRAAREALAGYLAAVERGSPFPGLGGVEGSSRGGPEGVGTRGGSEDHVAILCGAPDRVVRYAFEPLRREGSVPMPPGHVFVVGATGVVAEKKGSARERYNRLSDDAARAAELWRAATGEDHRNLGAILRDAGPERLLDALQPAARPDERDRLRRRVRHFAAESTEIIPAAWDALEAGDLARFGDRVDRSQELAGELLGNQVPETVHLARSARDLGATAASAFGAGFGGSVWAMIPASEVDDFTAAWRDRYLSRFPARAPAASFFITPAAHPARRL